METYGQYGMVNHSGEASLPGRESIARIVHGLDELIFPGFRENQGLDHNQTKNQSQSLSVTVVLTNTYI